MGNGLTESAGRKKFRLFTIVRPSSIVQAARQTSFRWTLIGNIPECIRRLDQDSLRLGLTKMNSSLVSKNRLSAISFRQRGSLLLVPCTLRYDQVLDWV